MRSETFAGLHIGSSSVKIVVAQDANGKMQIMGASSSLCQGMRRDAVADMEEVEKSIIDALEKVERISAVALDKVFIDIGGMHIEAQESKGVVAVSRADGEISRDDVQRALSAAQTISIPANREIIYVVAKSFSVDDQRQIKDPVGMNGVRLEAEAIILTGATPTIKNLTKCIFQSGVDILGTIPTAISAGKAVLTKRQKDLGAVVINIGAGTTSMAVYEDDELIHFATIPIGAFYITQDIALGLQIPIEMAERIKVDFGSAIPEEINRKDQIDISKIDSAEEGTFSRRKVAEIIEARMQEIFFLIDKELKKIGHQKLLPAGAILTGGGAKLAGAVDLAKASLKLPAQLGFPQNLSGIIDKVDDPSFAVAIGLALFASEDAKKAGKSFKGFSFLSGFFAKIKKWAGVFIP
ncbi:MAG: cell division protein FtsA [bacterium]